MRSMFGSPSKHHQTQQKKLQHQQLKLSNNNIASSRRAPPSESAVVGPDGDGSTDQRGRSRSRDRRRTKALQQSMQLQQQMENMARGVPPQHQPQQRGGGGEVEDDSSISSSFSASSSRRRNLGFMKVALSEAASQAGSSSSRNSRTSSRMTRTREHAKQLAMALSSSEVPRSGNFGSSGNNSSSFADFGTAFNSSNNILSDPFADIAKPPPFHGNEEEQTESTTHTSLYSVNDEIFASDPFSPEQQPDSFFAQNNNRSTAQQSSSSARPSKKSIVGQAHAGITQVFGSGGKRRTSTQQNSSQKDNALTVGTFSDPGATASDWPVVRVSAVADSPATKIVTTSSSRRNHNLNQQQQQQLPIDNNNNSSSALWRTPERRTGHSMNNTSASSIHSDTSSVTSSGAAARRLAKLRKQSRQQQQQPPLQQDAFGEIISSPNQNQHSPLTTTGANKSRSSTKPTDHVANYSNKSRAWGGGNRAAAAAPTNTATQPQSSSSSTGSSELNLFDSDALQGGFSFDAFGLDGAEMDRQVKEAMNDLAGSHPNMSMFFDNNDVDDDFASAGAWDHSTTASPNNDGGFGVEPERQQTDGFVDGFRWSSNKLPAVVKHSPPRSDRSSLTSESLDPNHASNNPNAAFNVFKQQAGFHKTNRTTKIVRPNEASPRQQTKGSSTTSPTIRMVSGFKASPRQQQLSAQPTKSTLPQIPNIVDSPSRRRKEQVEFFGEDSSSASSAGEAAPSSSFQVPTEKALLQQQSSAPRNAASDVGGADFASDAGVASDVMAPWSDSGGGALQPYMLPFVEIKGKNAKSLLKHHAQNNSKSESVRTESTAATSSVEEKKDDDNNGFRDAEELLSPAATVSTLRSKWETHESAASRLAEQRLRERQQVPSALSKAEIARLQAQLGSELLSPEKLMTPEHLFQQQQQQDSSFQEEEEHQRQSDARPRVNATISRTPQYASKSDGGAAVRRTRTVSSILTNIEKKEGPSPTYNSMRSDLYEDDMRKPAVSQKGGKLSSSTVQNEAAFHRVKMPKAKSEVGTASPRIPVAGQFESQAQRSLRSQQYGSPSFVQNIASPSSRQSSSGAGFWRESSPRSKALAASPRVAQVTSNVSDPGVSEPPERKLTYRERREIEIQRQKEEERKAQPSDINSPRQRDVAALIKRRIASNRKNAADASNPSSSPLVNVAEAISVQRNRLKPTGSSGSAGMLESAQRGLDEGATQYSGQEQQLIYDNSVDYSAPFEVSQSIKRPSSHSAAATEPPANNSAALLRQERSKDSSLSELPVNPVALLMKQRAASSASQDNDDYIPKLIQKRAVLSSPGPQKPDSPSRPSRPGARELSELAIEASNEQITAPSQRKVEANPAVSHMMMLQQMQQDVPSALVITNKSPVRSLSELPHEGSADEMVGKGRTPKATKMMLNAFLAGRESISSSDGLPVTKSASLDEQVNPTSGLLSPGRKQFPALKEDPKYARYFKMLKLGMPMDVVKHAMTRDGLDASVMDGDHNKPVGIPLKDDPQYTKYFKMLKIGLPMEAVKHSMERDGLDSAVMDQDHNLPAATGKKACSNEDDEHKERDSHRRARLHWNTLRKVTSNSLWAKIDQDDSIKIEIDEQEFQNLFQAEKNEAPVAATSAATPLKRISAVRVIDPKRANNGGIILARLKMSHDDMADAVDRIDEQALSAEQIENIIEYLPTKEEGKALEAYMLEGGQDAAEKFDGLCECEKFMVSMMTVKHAKRKVSALLFKLQFEDCITEIQQEALAIEKACEELSNSVRLRQLLGIVLTFGNRLNTAGNGKRKAGAFTLDSLLKLKQAKAFDKKTTFLHYIVLIVRRSNEFLLNFKDDIPTVYSADKIFWDQCVADLEEVENQLENVRKIALYQAQQQHAFRRRRKARRDDPEESLSDNEESLSLEEEVEALRATPIGIFTLSAIKYVSALRDKVESTKDMFAHLLEYFGEQERKLQPHELFSIIVNFSRDFDKAKQEVFENEKNKQREERKKQAGANKVKTLNGRQDRLPTQSPQTERSAHTSERALNLYQSHGGVLHQPRSNPNSQNNIAPKDYFVQTDRQISSTDFVDAGGPSSSVDPFQQQLPRTTQEVPVHQNGIAVDRRTKSMAAVRAKAKLRMNRSKDSVSSSPRDENCDDSSCSGRFSQSSPVAACRRSSSPGVDGGAEQPLSPRSSVRESRQKSVSSHGEYSKYS